MRKGGRNKAPTISQPAAPPPAQGIREAAITAKLVPKEKTELMGPYECPTCAGHMMLDATYLDQVNEIVTCPYCKSRITPEDV